MISIDEIYREQRRKEIELLPQIEVKHSLKVHIIHNDVKALSGDVKGSLREIMISGRFEVSNITKCPTDLLEYKCNALFYESNGAIYNDLVETDVFNECMQFSVKTGSVEVAEFASTGRWIKCN